MGLRAALDTVAKRKILCPCREWNAGRPARGLVTVLTELPRLPNNYVVQLENIQKIIHNKLSKTALWIYTSTPPLRLYGMVLN
jgi:hypothetical protein